ncbi:MAG: glycosyltransferase family 39 protein, partial [Anaerolineae bacterium]|nr:glycosyltransferase family 39 protein [Anaerolineae bacterium]
MSPSRSSRQAPSLSGSEARLLGALLVAGLAIRLALAWLPVSVLIEKTLPDDAFYYFAIARNLAQGRGFSVDGVTPTNGFHPLWALLLVPAFRWASGPDLPIHLALTLAALLDVATGWLAFRTVRQAGGRYLAAILAAFLYAFNPAVIFQAANGLETALSTLLWAACFHVYLGARGRAERRGAWWFGLGLLSGLMVLARTDAVFLLAFLGLDLLLRQRERAMAPLAALALGTFVPLVPWLTWNRRVMGTWLQSSGVAVPYVHHEHFRRALAAGTPFLQALGSTLGAAVGSGFVAFWQVAGVATIGWMVAWGAAFFYRSRLAKGGDRAVLQAA